MPYKVPWPAPAKLPPIVMFAADVAVNCNCPLPLKAAVTFNPPVLFTASSNVWIVSPLARRVGGRGGAVPDRHRITRL